MFTTSPFYPPGKRAHITYQNGGWVETRVGVASAGTETPVLQLVALRYTGLSSPGYVGERSPYQNSACYRFVQTLDVSPAHCGPLILTSWRQHIISKYILYFIFHMPKYILNFQVLVINFLFSEWGARRHTMSKRNASYTVSPILRQHSNGSRPNAGHKTEAPVTPPRDLGKLAGVLLPADCDHSNVINAKLLLIFTGRGWLCHCHEG